MCTITHKTNLKEVTGYKILGKRGNTYYSTFTGQRIRRGKVPKAPKYAKRLSLNWKNKDSNKKLKDYIFFNKSFCGKTSIYKDRKKAKILHNEIILSGANIKTVLVKITLTGEIYQGYHNYRCKVIYASDTIKEIKEVQFDETLL